MKDTYLITGATGFVGSNLTRRLVENGEKVYVLARNKELNWRIKDIAHKLRIVQADLVDSGLERKITKIRPTVVVHLASYGTSVMEESLSAMIDTNVNGLINLISALKNSPLRLFVNTGTSSEYGVYPRPTREIDALRPVNDYGITKGAATLFCQKKALKDGLPIITLRLYSPFGYYDESERLIPTVILKALRNDIIKVSSGKNVRDFVFIEDVLDAYMKVLNKNVTPGDIFNIGSGVQHSVEDVVQEIVSYIGSNSKISWDTIAGQKRQIEPVVWKANIKKAKSELRWSPKVSFSKGIQKTVDWFDKNRQLYDKN